MGDYTEAEKGEIKADLEAMYKAGRHVLPERAKKLAEVAGQMSGTIDTANSRSAQMGDHPVLLDVLDMAIDCQAGVVRAVQALNNLAGGVVAIADDFVDRDDYAKSVFNGLSDDLKSGQKPLPEVPESPDKDQVKNEGDGSDYEENPDVESPDDERENRDDELDDAQDDVPLPER